MAFQGLGPITLPPVDERIVAADLNGDGVLGEAREIVRRETYLGAASDHPVTRMIYPEGTEFLHSVRYVGVSGDEIAPARRMKELR